MRDLADFVDDVDEAKMQMERVLLEYRAGMYTVDLPSRRVWQLDDLILALADEVLALRQAQGAQAQTAQAERVEDLDTDKHGRTRFQGDAYR